MNHPPKPAIPYPADLLILEKRAVRIAGHATSLSLERFFWQKLDAYIKTRNISRSVLLREIDRWRLQAERPDQPPPTLAGAVRIYLSLENVPDETTPENLSIEKQK